MSKPVKCQAKDPKTCRVHGTNSNVLTADILHGRYAYYDIRDKIKELDSFINTKAAKDILTYEQFEQAKEQIKTYQWQQDTTAEGYQKAYEEYYTSSHSLESEAKIVMIEEARNEFEQKHPEAYKKIQDFNKTVQTYGTKTYFPSKGKNDTEVLKEIYSELSKLPEGSKFALEFYDGTRLIRTVEKQESNWKRVFSNHYVPRPTISIPPLENIKNINLENTYVSLGQTETGANIANIKQITLLADNTPKVFTTPRKPLPSSQNSDNSGKGYFQINSEFAEGIFYQNETRQANGSKLPIFTSANNFYDYTDDVTITPINK